MISVRAKLNNLTYNIRHPFDEKEGNRHKIIAEGCLNSVAANLVGGNFLTGLLIYLNASNFELGIINVIAYVCNILQILSPLLLSRFERMKKMLIGSRIVTHFINIVMIGIISAIPMGSNRVQIYMILGCIALLNVVSAATAQGFTIWHFESIPEKRRADHFAQNSIFVNLAAYIFILSGSAMLDWFKAENMELTGLLILRVVGVIFAALDIFCLAKIKEYPYGETVGPVSLKQIVTVPLKHKKYLRSVLIIFLWNFVGNTCGSYFSVYLLDTLQMSYSFMNICSALYVPIVTLMGPLWARYINRTSWLSALYKVMFIYGIIHVTHAFVMDGFEWFYIVVALLCHLFSPAINIIISNMSFYHLPRESQSVCLPFSATFTYIGAMCGTGYAILFMTLFEDLQFSLLGMTFYAPQIMTVITGVFIFVYGIVVKYLDSKEIAEKKLEEMAPVISE